jgi:hypothetical protein
MSSPIVALKEAIRLRLASDAALLALIRAPKVYPEPPPKPVYPFIAFVAAEARENGTSSDDGHVIDLTLGVFTRGTGSGEGPRAAEAVRLALGGAAGPAEGWRDLADTREDPRGDGSSLTALRVSRSRGEGPRAACFTDFQPTEGDHHGRATREGHAAQGPE